MSDDQVTVLPNFCGPCLSLLVHGAGFGPDDTWRALVVVAQLGLFQAASADERVWQRCSPVTDYDRDHRDLSLVLAEIGCLGCFKPRTLGYLVRAVHLDGLSAVAQEVKRLPWPDWDVAR